MFITFEGLDCTGKSTQLRNLAIALEEQGVKAISTREPGGTFLAEQMRTFVKENASQLDPLSEILMFNAARVENFNKVVKPALSEGHIVLGDRSFDSTFAYQGALGNTQLNEALAQIHGAVFQGFAPDLTLLFDIPVEQYVERKIQRGQVDVHDKIEDRDIKYFEKVRQNFLDRAHINWGRIVVIDGTASIEEINEQVIKPLAKLIKDTKENCSQPSGLAFLVSSDTSIRAKNLF